MMKTSTLLPPLAAFFFTFGQATIAHAIEPTDACFVAARGAYEQYKKRLDSRNEKAGLACFAESTPRLVSLDNPAKLCNGKPKIVYALRPDALKAYKQPQRLDRLPGGKCNEIFFANVEPGGDDPGPPPAGPGGSAAQPTATAGDADADQARRQELRRRADSDDAISLLQRRLEGASESRGDADQAALTGGVLPDAAAEALQILGQIVVDRASQAAYRLLGDKIREGLSCGEGDRLNPNTPFQATCEAMRSVRPQDIAMSRDVLVRALAADAVGQALRPHLRPSKGAPTGAVELLSRTTPLALSAISDAGSQRKAVVARAIAEELRSLAQEAVKNVAAPLKAAGEAQRIDPLHGLAPELKPVVLAGAALASCDSRIAARDLTRLASCDVGLAVDRLAKDVRWDVSEVRAPAVARSIARSMQIALDGVARDGDDKSASTQRVGAALAGVFDAACYAVKRNDPLGCPAVLDQPPDYDLGSALAPFAVARGVLEAALEQDTNRLVASIGRGLELYTPKSSEKGDKKATEGHHKALASRRRALRLLAGLAQYAQTFADAGKTDREKHEQRTKVLESLTADMTDRTGREGEGIWSLGGSLALIGGARVPGFGGEGGAVYSGPLALTLGGAFHNVPAGSGPGWHLELGVVDLAQYLSFRRESEAGDGAEKAVVVRKPKLPDALAPSLKVGVQWGRETPAYVAGFAQYAPFYEFEKKDGGADRHGAFVFGLALGVYVPLFDVN